MNTDTAGRQKLEKLIFAYMLADTIANFSRTLTASSKHDVRAAAIYLRQRAVLHKRTNAQV